MNRVQYNVLYVYYCLLCVYIIGICHFNVLFSNASQQVLLILSFVHHIVSVAR